LTRSLGTPHTRHGYGGVRLCAGRQCKTVTNSERNQRMRTKHGLKALGLCLVAALSVMAITAAGAQAKGDWRVEGTNTIATKTVTATPEDMTLDSTVGGAKVKILCNTLTLTDGLLFVGGAALAKLEFSTCETYLNLVRSAVCDPKNPPITATVKALLILDTAVPSNTLTYILFSPDDGTLKFTTIEFDEECSLPEKLEVTGHLVAECSDALCTASQNTHLIKQVTPASLFPNDVLKFGQNSAELLGGAVLKLSGGDLNKPWSAEML
jgi:hypothetical protein